MSDGKFTKVMGRLLVNVRDLAEWGVETGNITENDLRAIVIKRDPALRREAALKLIEAGASRRRAAMMLGVDESTVRADLRENPASCAGESRTRDEKEAAIRERNAQLKLVKTDAVAKRYGTINIDPPWDVEKIKRDVRPNQVAFDYPTMTEDELLKFDVKSMAEDDCHLFCWTVQTYLLQAFRLVEVWGFRFSRLMTWHKGGGFQPHGMPQNNSEFVVYARRGNPQFRETTAFCTCFQGERREHSRKPDEFYNMIRRVTSEGRIDVFSREKREGFDQYGNEVAKFDELSA